MALTKFAPALLFSCLLSLNVNAETLTIRADNWFPMNGEPNDPRPGFMIEFAKHIMKEHGVEVDYQTMPWERSLRSVRNGIYDCVVGAYEVDAPDFLFPEEEWGMDSAYVYARLGNSWRYTGLDSLKGKKIGLIGGYTYEEELDKYVKENKKSGQFDILKGNNALERNIKKVLNGRIDATVESQLVMNATLKEMDLMGALVQVGEINSSTPMYIACTPNSERTKQFIKWIDEGTRKMRASGKLKEILEKYGLTDWK